jgi:phytoene synthase
MTASPSDYEQAGSTLAALDRDLWLSSLFVPEGKRPHVQALWTFAQEIARIPLIVSEPMLGEIRLQWWREVMEGERAGEAAQNPSAAALLATIAQFSLPRPPFIALLEARKFDLYHDVMPTLNDLEGYCGETASAVFRMASMVLSDSGDPGTADISGHAGVAWGMTRILRDLPFHARRGQCFLPRDVLARHGERPETVSSGEVTPALLAALAEIRQKAREHFALARTRAKQLPQPVSAAYVPLAVVPLYLRTMERRGYEPFRHVIEPAQWRRQWTMWRW